MPTFIDGKIEHEQALVTTANAVHSELQAAEVRNSLSTFKIINCEGPTTSVYGDYTPYYDLIIPDPASQLKAIFISGGEITYLAEKTPGNLKNAKEYDLPKIYEAIMNARPDAHKRRGGNYDSSAPCTISMFGTHIDTIRDTGTTSADEFIEKLIAANEMVLKAREAREIHFFRKNSDENPFQRAARLRKEKEAELNANQNNTP